MRALTALVVAIILFISSNAAAIPLRYWFNGTITNYLEHVGYEHGDYEHHPFYTGQKIEGFINWDTDLLLSPYPGQDLHYAQLDGMNFLEIYLFDEIIVRPYNQLFLNVQDSEDGDNFLLYSHGGGSYTYGNIEYAAGGAEYRFSGSSDLYNGDSPGLFRFDSFTDVNFSLYDWPSFTDLSDGSIHNYTSTTDIDVSEIRAVPEPGQFLVLFIGLLVLVFIRGALLRSHTI
jgi:hypothetical protein